MSATRHPPELKARITHLREQGHTVQQISEALGIPASTAAYHALPHARAGTRPSTVPLHSRNLRAAVLEYHADGMPPGDIVRFTGAPRGLVERWLADARVPEPAAAQNCRSLSNFVAKTIRFRTRISFMLSSLIGNVLCGPVPSSGVSSTLSIR